MPQRNVPDQCNQIIIMCCDKDPGENTCWLEIESGLRSAKDGLARAFRYLLLLRAILTRRRAARARLNDRIRVRKQLLGLKVIEGGNQFKQP